MTLDIDEPTSNYQAFEDPLMKSFFHDDDDDRLTESEQPTRRRRRTDPLASSVLRLPTMPVRSSAFYGWLWKRGTTLKTWKKRFFLLNGSTLTYYTDACVVATEFGERCLQMAPNGGLRVGSVALTNATEFGLCIKSSGGRVLYVQAGDKASRMKWLEVLQAASMKRRFSDTTLLRSTCASEMSLDSTRSTDSCPTEAYSPLKAPSNTSSTSSTTSSEDDEEGLAEMRGWLYFRRRGFGLYTFYRKRYVVLLEGHLTVSSKQRDPRPNDQRHEVVSAAIWHGRAHGLHLKLGNNKELWVSARSSEEQKRWLLALHNNL